MKLSLMKRIKLALYGPARFEVRQIHPIGTLSGRPINITSMLVDGYVYRDGCREVAYAHFCRDQNGKWHPQYVTGEAKFVGVVLPPSLNSRIERKYQEALRLSSAPLP